VQGNCFANREFGLTWLKSTFFIMELLALAVAPGIAICLFIYFKDKYNKEPLGVLVMSFILGMFSLVPAFFSEVYFSGIQQRWMTNGVWFTAVFAYIIVAFSEEFCKYIVVRFYCYTRKSFDEPFDGIVYSVMVGMGFATLENIGYVYQNGFGNGVVRMLLSVPAHGTFAVLMGYFVSLAKFKPAQRGYYLLLAIVLPVLFHGTYDFFLFVGKTWMHFAGALASFLIAIRLSFIAIKRKQLYSKQYLEDIAKVHEKQEEIL
jgi:protease PrsW